jgi:hypothetical protein
MEANTDVGIQRVIFDMLNTLSKIGYRWYMTSDQQSSRLEINLAAMLNHEYTMFCAAEEFIPSSLATPHGLRFHAFF